MKKGIQLLNKKLIILFLILVIAGFFRFWKLESYPVSLSIDEVAVGYNAYSILKTGKDEHGEFLPLSFLSIGDYKTPLHIYLAIPTIAAFGLTEFGVRFSMALFSTLTVITVFLLIRQLTKKEEIAILTSFVLAVSPWHIHHARFSYEVILGLFLVTTAVWLFLRALENKGRLLWLSAVLFGLSIYSYHVERVFTPIFVLGLAIIYRQFLFKYKTQVTKAVVVGLVLLAPLIPIILGSAGQTRAKMVFITKDPVIQGEIKKDKTDQNVIDRIFDNNFVIVANHWTKKYLNYFDPEFLFFEGMPFTQPGRPNVGILYLFELPLVLIGAWLIFAKKIFQKSSLILFWLLTGPLVASLTIEEQHISRSLVAIPIPQLLTATGFWWFWQKIKIQKNFIRNISVIFAASILTFSIIYYLNLYYVHYPIQYSHYWQYGWKEAALYAWKNKDKYREIVVDPKFGPESPLIISTPPAYFLFYGKYDPELYQKSPRRTEKLSTNFENFTFRPIFWQRDRERANTLFIGSPWVLPRGDIADSQIKKVIKFKNGVDALLTVESNGTKKFRLE